MRNLVPHVRVIELIKRTIMFLRRLEPISPTLRVDALILENTLDSLHRAEASYMDASVGT